MFDVSPWNSKVQMCREGIDYNEIVMDPFKRLN